MDLLRAAALGIPVAALITWGVIHGRRNISGLGQFLSVVILIVYFPAGAVAYYVLKWNMFYGLSYYVLVIAGSVLFLVGVGYDKIESGWPAWFLLIPVVLLAVAVPLAILPSFTLGTISTAVEPPKEVSTKPILESLESIKEALGNAESQLYRESKNIDTLTASLIREIEDKNRELRNIQTERERTQTELAYYKALASLSKEQADAVINALKRGKYVDYLVGFAIGLVSSGIFFVIQAFHSRK